VDGTLALHVTNSPFSQEQAELLNRLLPTLSDYQRTWLSAYITTLTFRGQENVQNRDAQAVQNGAAIQVAPNAPAASSAQAALAVPGATTASAATLAQDIQDGQTAQSVSTVQAASAAQTASAAEAAQAAAAPVAPVIAPVASAAPMPKEATVLFGSQSGNAQRLAKQLAQKLEGQGFQVKLSAMSDYKTNELQKARNLFIVVSTHGEGEPPDNAVSFYEFLHSKRAPRLDGTNFSVLALGDTSYEFFCKTGKDFDQRLEALGAKRLVPRADCDVDFEETAAAWIKQVVAAAESVSVSATENAGTASAASAGAGAGAAPAAVSLAAVPAPVAAAAAVTAATPAASAAASGAEEPAYSRSNPFLAEVLQNINLNGRGSDKQTHHIEISLAGSGLTYEPGDCLGVYPENHPRLVDEIIYVMGWNEKELVQAPKSDEWITLRDALLRHYEITLLSRKLVEQTAELTGASKLKELLKAGNEQELKSYIQGRDLLDLVRDYELRGTPASKIIPLLRKLPPRLYSISSSLKAAPDEAHITVGAVRYQLHGRTRFGVASVYLAERALPGRKLPVFVQHNPHFKLPQDPSAPIIMIGPGTGVAPFRAFMMEREETGAEGRSWLFFGEQHFRTDFLYQTEWQRWLKDGVLTRIDLAFSRDTDSRIYVQHRMAERSRELYAWLEEGAHVYVCGDKSQMAKDVHAALLDIVQQEGGMTGEKAAEYLARMQQEKRYQRDVY
jgi:sulfite reductase (NADPH) flavoprotein alpha-component